MDTNNLKTWKKSEVFLGKYNIKKLEQKELENQSMQETIVEI